MVILRRRPDTATELPVGQKINQDPTVREGTPLGAQCATARPLLVIAGSGHIPLNRPVTPPDWRFGERVRLGVLTEEISPELVDEVVALTGCGERRRRLLPPGR